MNPQHFSLSLLKPRLYEAGEYIYSRLKDLPESTWETKVFPEEILTTLKAEIHVLPGIMSYVNERSLCTIADNMKEVFDAVVVGDCDLVAGVEKLTNGAALLLASLDHFELTSASFDIGPYTEAICLPRSPKKLIFGKEYRLPPDYKTSFSERDRQDLAERTIRNYVRSLASWLKGGFKLEPLRDIYFQFSALKTAISHPRLANLFWLSAATMEIVIQKNDPKVTKQVKSILDRMTMILEALVKSGESAANETVGDKLMEFLVACVKKAGSSGKDSRDIHEYYDFDGNQQPSEELVFEAVPADVEIVMQELGLGVRFAGRLIDNILTAEDEDTFQATLQRLNNTLIRLLSVSTIIRDNHPDFFDSIGKIQAKVAAIRERDHLLGKNQEPNRKARVIVNTLVGLDEKISGVRRRNSFSGVFQDQFSIEAAIDLAKEILGQIKLAVVAFNEGIDIYNKHMLYRCLLAVHSAAAGLQFMKDAGLSHALGCVARSIQWSRENDKKLSPKEVDAIADVLVIAEFELNAINRGCIAELPKSKSLDAAVGILEHFPEFKIDWNNEPDDRSDNDLVLVELSEIASAIQSKLDVLSKGVPLYDLIGMIQQCHTVCEMCGQRSLARLSRLLVEVIVRECPEYYIPELGSSAYSSISKGLESLIDGIESYVKGGSPTFADEQIACIESVSQLPPDDTSCNESKENRAEDSSAVKSVRTESTFFVIEDEEEFPPLGLIDLESITLARESFTQIRTEISKLLEVPKPSDEHLQILSRLFHTLRGNCLSCFLATPARVYGIFEETLDIIVSEKLVINFTPVFHFMKEFLASAECFLSELEGPADMLNSHEILDQLSVLNWLVDGKQKTEEEELKSKLADKVTEVKVSASAAKSAQNDSSESSLPLTSQVATYYEESLIDIVLDEFNDLNPAIQNGLNKLIAGNPCDEDIKELNRHVHTMKASVRMAGAEEVGYIFHALEDLTNLIRAGVISVDDRVRSLLSVCRHEISLGKEAMLHQRPYTIPTNLRHALTVLIEQKQIFGVDDEYNKVLPDEPPPAVPRTVELSIPDRTKKEPATKDEVNPRNQLLSSLLAEKNKRLTVRKRVERGETIHAKIANDTLQDIGESATDTLAGIHRAKISVRGGTVHMREMQDNGRELLKLTNELELLLSGGDLVEQNAHVIMQNFKKALRKNRVALERMLEHQIKLESAIDMPRRNCVRLLGNLRNAQLVSFDNLSDTIITTAKRAARTLGKAVHVEISGGLEKFDRTILESLGGAIRHIINNSVTHGIESTADRENSGKPTTGLIKIAVSRLTRRMQISIQDDGAGINREKVLKKAKALGIVSEDAEPSDKEILHLITIEGFSTSESVNETAGRGVGMDAVVNVIRDIGGSLDIESEKGRYTRFDISFPISLGVGAVIVAETKEHRVCFPSSGASKIYHGKIQVVKGIKCCVNGNRVVPVFSIPDFFNDRFSHESVDAWIMEIDVLGYPIGICADKFDELDNACILSAPYMLDDTQGLLGFTEDEFGEEIVVVDAAHFLSQDKFLKHVTLAFENVTLHDSGKCFGETVA